MDVYAEATLRDAGRLPVRDLVDRAREAWELHEQRVDVQLSIDTEHDRGRPHTPQRERERPQTGGR